MGGGVDDTELVGVRVRVGLEVGDRVDVRVADCDRLNEAVAVRLRVGVTDGVRVDVPV